VLADDTSCANCNSCHVPTHVQPIADSAAQHLEILSKNFQFSTKAYQDSHGIRHLLLGANRKSHGPGSLEKF